MKIFWQISNLFRLAVIEERIYTEILLPLQDLAVPFEDSNITISVLNGSIPRGMRLENNKILGTPFEVEIDTNYKFLLRAERFGIVDDREFEIVVRGDDDPVWITPGGTLDVGPNNTYYIVDSSIVDYQLEAFDPDTISGDIITYYIDENDGQLPPGINLSESGRLFGVVEPILAIEKSQQSGHFDTHLYGTYPYDFYTKPNNGFDSYYYDVETFDLSLPTGTPKKLNRHYEFRVSITDGITTVKRKFTIFVVGDDYFRADNTVMTAGTGLYRADNTFLRTPKWLTPSDLGVRRANNYITLVLDTIDTNLILGTTYYTLLETNPDGSPSILPPGTDLDPSNGEIAGRVPYQPAIAKTYTFTVRATRAIPNYDPSSNSDKTFTLKILGEVESFLNFTTEENLGTVSSNYNSELSIQATTTVPGATLLYTLKGGRLPPGLTMSHTGEIIGKINSYGNTVAPGLTIFTDTVNDSEHILTFDNNTTTIDRKFIFEVKVQDHYGFSAITKEFNVTVEDPKDKFFSNLYVTPMLTENKRLEYFEFISQNELIPTNFIYRPNDPNFGIQKKMKMLIYSGIETRQVSDYAIAFAKNHKRKKFKFGRIESAVAKRPGTNDVIYEIIYVNIIDPADKINARTKEKFTINTKRLLTVDAAHYDIEPDNKENEFPAGSYVLQRNGNIVTHFFTPNFDISTRENDVVNVSVSQILVTPRIGTELTLQSTIQGTPAPFRFRPNNPNPITIDSDALKIDSKTQYEKYLSNISNMRNKIKNLGETEIEYLPLWMRSSQQGQVDYIGYKTVVPICYCKPGYSERIIANIKNSGFDYSNFNFDIDRYIIDSTTGIGQEQYLLFNNYEYNL
jgi:hypothetical protein